MTRLLMIAVLLCWCGGAWGQPKTMQDIISGGGECKIGDGPWRPCEDLQSLWYEDRCEPGWELVIRTGPAPKEGIFKDSIGHWSGLACAWVVKDAIR